MTGIMHEFQCKLALSSERAFAVLSEANELGQWFAEHVEVEPKQGGTYRFWGKHTYGAPARRAANQKLVRYEKPHALAFTWTLHDRPSQVTYVIEPDPENAAGVIVKGRHEFSVAPAIDRAREMVDDLWRLHVGNLQSYVESGKPGLLLDFGNPAPEVRVSILIDAPRELVFQAMLKPEMLNKWIASAASVEPRVGGRYTYGWQFEHTGVTVEGGPTRILELVENEKLVTDWPDWRGDKSVPAQKVTWLLESVGKQTRVTLTHTGFVRPVDISDYPFGWGFFLDRLRLTAEDKEVPQMDLRTA